MKKSFKYIYILVLALAISCNESDDVVTADAKIGGLMEASNQSINYVVGEPEGPYTLEFLVRQGGVKVNTINVYRSFQTIQKYTVIEDGKEVEKSKTFTSNEVLDRTINVTEDKNHHVSTAYTFSELKSDLQVENLDGETNPLAANDGDYQIGDKWVFRVESVLDDGRVVQQPYQVAVSVSTRYAGKYKAVAAEYYRLGVLTYTVGDWPAETVIESVDATTYRVVEYLGAAPFTGNEYYFQINNGVITYPDKRPDGTDQVGNGQPWITCQSNPVDMTPVHCATSNIVINDDATGKDRLVMSFGYFTPGSGPRTFYQVLEKIVD
jgi:hypothetical protein